MVDVVRKDITKEEAARRQIETAIRLLFANDDAICIHVIASSAQIIVTDVCRNHGKNTVTDMLAEYIRPEALKDFRRILKSPYNYFKHAKRDTDTELAHFDEGMNDIILWFAVIDYITAFSKPTATMLCFLAWFIAVNPKFVKPGMPELDEVVVLIKKVFGGIDKLARHEQKLRGLSAMKLIPVTP